MAVATVFHDREVATSVPSDPIVPFGTPSPVDREVVTFVPSSPIAPLGASGYRDEEIATSVPSAPIVPVAVPGYSVALEMSAAAGPLAFAAGGVLGQYRLLAELGRGAQGRVYLATQPDLADRPVALKVTDCRGQEHLWLARLQHTNVMPLYSAQDDAEHGLRILCMPYYGRSTLACLVKELAPIPLAQRTGRDLLAALDRLQAASPHPELAPPPAGPGRAVLARADYAQAVAWLTAGLADGLAYAHHRGLVHLDVKPSNVLVGADGTPMLLDFHLANPPLPVGGVSAAWVGGTIGFMAPEQQRAMAAYRGRRPLAEAVDGRADLFALGCLMYQALGGKLPAVAGRSPAPHQFNPQVSLGLSDIIMRCLAAKPADRYPGAAELATDLRRYLADLPLIGVRNRSLGERWQKWRRRRPHGLTPWFLTAVVSIALAMGGWYTLERADRHGAEARSARADGQDQLRHGHAAVAAATFRHGQARAAGTDPGLADELGGLARDAETQAARDQLHRGIDELRRAFPFERMSEADLRTLDDSCRPLWERSGAISGELGLAVARDFVDLAVFTAELRARLAADPASGRREALALLANAETRFGPGPVLATERRRHQSALGLPSTATADPQPRTAWEYYAVGRSWLADGDLRQAAAALEAAVRLEPEGLWPNFAWGQCAYRLKRYDDALAAFSVCIGLAPGAAEVYFNRGQASAALGRVGPARADFDRALTLAPRLAAAALNRGVLSYTQGRLADAETDFRRALAAGADPVTVNYNLALTQWADGRRTDARVSLNEALRLQPSHAEARALLDRMGR